MLMEDREPPGSLMPCSSTAPSVKLPSMTTRLILLLAAALSLPACTASYTERETSGTEATSIRLDRDKPVYVARPADGKYGNRAYPGSGSIVSQKTAAAYSRHSRRVQTAPSIVTDREQLLAAARAAGAGYLVIPTISHWEQRATEWSGIPARISIGMVTIDVATGQELRSGYLESRSAVMTLVRPNPDRLVQHMVDRHVDEMFGGRVSATQ
jgi:hypothetical protein